MFNFSWRNEISVHKVSNVNWPLICLFATYCVSNVNWPLIYLPLTVLEKILLCSIMYSRYQNAYVLIPGISEYITLYGKKDFVGIVKVNCLEMKLPWNILVGLI